MNRTDGQDFGLGGALIASYYNNKVESDRGEIEKILNSSEPVTISTIVERLHIPADVLEYHFDNILINCPDDDKNRVCDRILEVRGEPTKEDQKLAQRLRIESKRNLEITAELTNEVNILRSKIKDIETKNNDHESEIEQLTEKITEKDKELLSLTQSYNKLKDDQAGSVNLTSQLENLKSELMQSSSSLETLRSEKISIQQQLVHQQTTIEQLESQLANKEQLLQNAGSIASLPLEEEENEQVDYDKELSKKRRNVVLAVSGSVVLVVLVTVYFVMQSSKPATPIQQPAIPASLGVPQPASTQQTQDLLKAQSVEPAQPTTEPKPNIINTLNDAQSFRDHAAEFKINGQSIVFSGEAFTIGQSINGFKVMSVDATFFRLQDPVSGLVFRVDIAVVGGNQ